ncbi:hypothetical protein PENSPDRAFT_694918 [Peniophora sp. CONT]|nr:hypothetical protein PENSPDRAFT_694918 [Peniophora sp. CONT]
MSTQRSISFALYKQVLEYSPPERVVSHADPRMRLSDLHTELHSLLLRFPNEYCVQLDHTLAFDPSTSGFSATELDVPAASPHLDRLFLKHEPWDYTLVEPWTNRLLTVGDVLCALSESICMPVSLTAYVPGDPAFASLARCQSQGSYLPICR